MESAVLQQKQKERRGTCHSLESLRPLLFLTGRDHLGLVTGGADIRGQLPTDPEVVDVLAGAHDGVSQAERFQVIQVAVPRVLHLAVVPFKDTQAMGHCHYTHSHTFGQKGAQFLIKQVLS